MHMASPPPENLPVSRKDSKILTIIIVSYKSAAVIEKCLGPMIDLGKYPVIIVDNASPDSSASKLAKRFIHAEILGTDQNLGYGRAANLALSKITTPYALLLNPDLVAGQTEIDQLLEIAMKDCDRTAIWGPATTMEMYRDASPMAVDFVNGSALLLHMEHVRTLDFFDENIFLFYEETDLCLRTVKAGFSVKLCPKVLLRHLGGQSSAPDQKIDAMKSWHFGWSRSYYFAKHGLSKGKRHPLRQYLQYRLKSLFSGSAQKRMQFRWRARGTRDFMSGEHAFLKNGRPQKMPGFPGN
jgi:GT2 family glycosyltransferase